MKEKMKWNDYDSLPLILDVTDIQHTLHRTAETASLRTS